MSAPRHLWSGDWEQDSAAHADALARRNAVRQDEPEPEEAPRPEPRAGASGAVEYGPPSGERVVKIGAALGRVLLGILRFIGLAVVVLAGGLRSLLRALWRAVARSDRRRLRLAVLAALLIVVVAVAVVAIFGSGGSGPSGGSASPAAVAFLDRWLGVQLTDVPARGVVFEFVEPNGLAGNEGFEPGDTVAQIDGHAINNLGDAVKSFSAVEGGDQITIAVTRGSSVYSASFPMPSRPPGGP